MDENKNSFDEINEILNGADSKGQPIVPPDADDIAAPQAPPQPESPAPDAQPQMNTAAPEPQSTPANSYPRQSEPQRRPEAYRNAPADGRPQPVHYNPNSAVPRKRKKKKRKKQHSRLPGVLILTTFIFGVSIVLSMVIIGFGKDMLGIGKSDETQLVVINEGDTTEDIANMLVENKIIKSADAFKYFSRLRKSDSSFVPGEHFVRPSMAYEAIIAELTKVQEEEVGESVSVMISEGTNLLDAAQILESNSICKADDFLWQFNSGGFGFEFESKLPAEGNRKFQKMEGFFFPDTYFFYENMKPEEVCQKIYSNFNNKMTEDRYKKMEELGLDLNQLITLASIVQKEAANEAEMPDIASVFWNRIRHPEDFNNKLQSDPTKNYANLVIKKHLDVADQALVDSYNTYETPGLPPGPICNPGIAAIDAVLADKQTDYFYFIANLMTGQTQFSATLEEHDAKQAEIEQSYIDNNFTLDR